MKLTAGKRIVIFFHALLSLLMCVALALRLIAPGLVSRVLSGIRGSMGPVGYLVLHIAALAICTVLAVAGLMIALNRGQKRSERGFIAVDSSESGRVRIAVSAIEQMVRQSVRSIDGISDMKIAIEGQDDAIGIAVDAVVTSGSHVPTLTRNMQRSIRQFVEVNCGVAVNDVSISINAVSAQSEGRRQRRWGRGKADRPAAPTPVTPVIGEEIVPEVSAPEPETEVTAQVPDGDAKSSGYDFDKPYESQFAKDLEALRAEEALDASEQLDGQGDIGPTNE